MIRNRTIIFLILASVFAAVHWFAITASLYWYYSWFDVVMHFWGGILVGLGVHTLATFSRIHIKPTLLVVILILALATGIWEVFEWFAGLYDPLTHTKDTTQDIIVGFSGGLLAHIILRKRTIGI